MSNSGELIIDSQQRILESQAAFFLFVNPKTGWIFSIKNTLENQKKLLTNQPIQNFKIISDGFIANIKTNIIIAIITFVISCYLGLLIRQNRN